METRRISLQEISVKETNSNAGLWLDKFIAGQNRKGDGTENSDNKFKQQLINDMAKIETPNIYNEFFNRWQESLVEVNAKFKSLSIDGRMVVGLGAEGVLETSIALHRTYGVPYISGSALKGLAASYAHRHLGNDWKREIGDAHKFVFGSQNSAGFLVFHDALLFPKIKNALHADIMTVHHGDYYGDKNIPPADWDSPVPIPFLSATGNYLAAISGVEGTDKWIEFVWLILGKALQEEGIGAKTSSGYGRAKLTNNYPKTARMDELERLQKEADRERVLREAAEAEELRKIEAKRRLEEFEAQIKAERQAEKERQQKNAGKGIDEIFEQIKAVEIVTKKTKKLFEDLVKLIYRLENAKRKRELSVDVLAEVARLDVKIEGSDKWFVTLKKLSAEK